MVNASKKRASWHELLVMWTEKKHIVVVIDFSSNFWESCVDNVEFKSVPLNWILGKFQIEIIILGKFMTWQNIKRVVCQSNNTTHLIYIKFSKVIIDDNDTDDNGAYPLTNRIEIAPHLSTSPVTPSTPKYQKLQTGAACAGFHGLKIILLWVSHHVKPIRPQHNAKSVGFCLLFMCKNLPLGILRISVCL